MIRKLRRLADPVWLTIAGLGCLAGAAWHWHTIAGLAATGLALLVLEWRIDQ